jgi:hypothetical protein
MSKSIIRHLDYPEPKFERAIGEKVIREIVTIEKRTYLSPLFTGTKGDKNVLRIPLALGETPRRFKKSCCGDTTIRNLRIPTLVWF